MKKSLASYVAKGRFYASVVEDGTDLIFVVDFDGTILYHNRSVRKTLGYTGKRLVGKSIFDFVESHTLPDFRQHYRKATQRTYTPGIEFQFRCADGAYKYLEFNAVNLFKKEKTEGLILDCRDITQRKRDAEELLRAQRAKELFLANISHEIRTPINGISGMASLLQENLPPQERQVYLQAIKGAADHLKVIINDILDLASIESGKLTLERISFSLRELLEALIATFRIQAREKGIDLTYTLKGGPDLIVGDPVRLNQVMMNLISNAIKFTPKGSIKVTLELETRKNNKIKLHIEVQDSGIGIPKDKLTTIFESFSQADASVSRKYGGTGLGLTIVKQLVELQQGTIKVKSREGEGSTFMVTLPYERARDRNNGVRAAELSTSQTRSLSHLRILLVEDNEINQLYAGSILQRWNIAHDLAQNGKQALELMNSHRYDIVLMDIQMPELDGYEATRQYRMAAPDHHRLPIVALTANATPNDLKKCLAAGMNDYLAKPFSPEDLYRILARHAQPASSRLAPDLSYLKKVSNGDEGFIRKMQETYVQTLSESVRQIQKNMDEENTARVAALIHQIKPSLALMGYPSLKSTAQALEESCKAGALPVTEIADFVASLQKTVEAVEIQLRGGS